MSGSTSPSDQEAERLRAVFAAHGIGNRRDRRPKRPATAARHALDAIVHFREITDDLDGSDLVALDDALSVLRYFADRDES